MSYEDRVLALFGEANPVSNESDVRELSRPTLQLIEHREDAMSDTKVRAIDTERPIVKQDRGRRLIYGAAAAVVALVVGTVGWFALAGGGDEAPDTGVSKQAASDQIAVIETFFQRWSDGKVFEAMSLVGDQDWTEGNVFIGQEMEYVIALEPDGWSWTVSNCTEQASGAYLCTIGLVGDPLFDALGVGAAQAQFRVEDGKLTQIPRVLGVDAAQADQRLAVYAQAQDPDGYEAACVGANGRAWEANGVVYNRECGAFLAPYLEPLAAELAAG